MTDPLTAETPLPFTAEQLAEQISDVLAANYYEPEGELADITVEALGDHDLGQVIWVTAPGSRQRYAVAIIPYTPEDELSPHTVVASVVPVDPA